MTADDRLYSRATRLLVAWFGAYQAVHVGVNLLGIPRVANGTLGFPAPSPGDAWSADLRHFLTAMAVLDLVNAILSLVFVERYFRRKPSALWLGATTSFVSLYGALVFGWGTFTAGAWSQHPWQYALVFLPYIPVVMLVPRVTQLLRDAPP